MAPLLCSLDPFVPQSRASPLRRGLRAVHTYTMRFPHTHIHARGQPAHLQPMETHLWELLRPALCGDGLTPLRSRRRMTYPCRNTLLQDAAGKWVGTQGAAPEPPRAGALAVGGKRYNAPTGCGSRGLKAGCVILNLLVGQFPQQYFFYEQLTTAYSPSFLLAAPLRCLCKSCNYSSICTQF